MELVIFMRIIFRGIRVWCNWFMITCPAYLLTNHLLRTMTPILADDIYKLIFLNENDKIEIQILLKWFSHESDWQEPNIDSGNGLLPNSRQAVTWTNGDLVHRWLYKALGWVNSRASDFHCKRIYALNINDRLVYSLCNRQYLNNKAASGRYIVGHCIVLWRGTKQ